MERLFLDIVNLSSASIWFILAIIVIRFVFRKGPKWINCLLWGLVAFRLICPISIESELSLLPSRQLLDPEEVIYETPQIHTGVFSINSAVNPVLAEKYPVNETASINPFHAKIAVFSVIWIVGMVVMAMYSALSYAMLRRRVFIATQLRKGVKQSENIDSPFVLGIIRPTIYIPYSLKDEDLEYVIAHEEAHIRPKDHLWKPLGFLILAFHWFNPFVWLAYILLCRDIEAACDEKVIKEMGDSGRRGYSRALLNCSIRHRSIAACPIAFGEVGVKTRIKSVMNYRKPTLWIVATAMVIVLIAAVCFLTYPSADDASEPFGHSYRVDEIAHQALQYSFGYTADTAPRYTFTSDFHLIVKNGSEDHDEGSFKECKLSPLRFDDYFKEPNYTYGWAKESLSADKLRKSTDKAWRLDVQDSEIFYYLLLTEKGEIYLTYGYDVGSGNAASENGSLIRWVFRLSRTDMLACYADDEKGETYIEPIYYPEGADRDHSQFPAGEISHSGRIRFKADWDADILVVSEHRYKGSFIEKETHKLEKGSDGFFEIEVSIDERDGEKAVYYVQGEKGVYIFEIIYTLENEGLSEGMVYVADKSLYMNPLSSSLFVPGLDGIRYIIKDDMFISDASNESAPDHIAQVSEWKWREFPYTDEEWTEMHIPKGFERDHNISEIYSELLYLPMKPGMFLVKADGEIWLVELGSNDKMGTYIWSILRLVPEQAE